MNLRGTTSREGIGSCFEMTFFIKISEKSAHGIKIVGCVGVIFMVVALRAAQGSSQPDTRYVSHSVRCVDGKVFFGLNAPFVRGLKK